MTALHPDTNYLLALTATGDFGGDFRVQVTESDTEDDEELDWEIEDAWRLNGQLVSWGDAWMIRVGGARAAARFRTIRRRVGWR